MTFISCFSDLVWYLEEYLMFKRHTYGLWVSMIRHWSDFRGPPGRGGGTCSLVPLKYFSIIYLSIYLSIYLLVLSRSILIIISGGWQRPTSDKLLSKIRSIKKNLGGPIKLFTIRRQRHAIHMPLNKLICKGFEFLCGLNRDHWGRETIPLWNSPREEKNSSGHHYRPDIFCTVSHEMPEFVSIL